MQNILNQQACMKVQLHLPQPPVRLSPRSDPTYFSKIFKISSLLKSHNPLNNPLKILIAIDFIRSLPLVSQARIQICYCAQSPFHFSHQYIVLTSLIDINMD